MNTFRKVALAAALGYPALASNITNLPALGANDLVNWATGSGSNGTNLFTATSTGGLTVTLSEPTSVFVNAQQSPPGGWFGNFPAGTHIIYDQGPAGPVKFTFATPVEGFGLTIDGAFSGGYTGTISEFNGTTLLGSYNTVNAAYGLMFLGVLDGTPDITSVTIATTAPSGNDSFAFGNLSLVDAATSGTPEPASVAMILLGFGLMIAVRRPRSARCL